MVYQESMMRVAQKFAGYTLAQADNLRAACSKKVREKMLEERVRFVEGCENTGYGKVLGEQLFKTIEGFADYAFNKSHAYGYGLLSYQTAYLKANYPVQYIAALLSSVKGNYEKAAIYLADARASNVAVLPRTSISHDQTLLPEPPMAAEQLHLPCRLFETLVKALLNRLFRARPRRKI